MSRPEPPARFTLAVRQLVPLWTVLVPDAEPVDGLLIVRRLRADSDVLAELSIARIGYERAIRRLSTSLASWQSGPLPRFVNDGSNGRAPWVQDR